MKKTSMVCSMLVSGYVFCAGESVRVGWHVKSTASVDPRSVVGGIHGVMGHRLGNPAGAGFVTTDDGMWGRSSTPVLPSTRESIGSELDAGKENHARNIVAAYVRLHADGVSVSMKQVARGYRAAWK